MQAPKSIGSIAANHPWPRHWREGVSCQRHVQAALYPGKDPGTVIQVVVRHSWEPELLQVTEASSPLDPTLAGSKPAENDGIFKGDKNPLRDSFRRGSKAVGPMS
jgi:hypothetical protein